MKTAILKQEIKWASQADADVLIEMQTRFLYQNMAADQRADNGFLTLVTPKPLLTDFIENKQVLVNYLEGQVAGYVFWIWPGQAQRSALVQFLTYLVHSEDHTYNGKAVKDYPYAIIGQICVDTIARGTGLFEQLYTSAAKEILSKEHELLLTFVHKENARSLSAHHRKAHAFTLGHYNFQGTPLDLILMDNRVLAAL